jgi:hypothetical protein
MNNQIYYPYSIIFEHDSKSWIKYKDIDVEYELILMDLTR